MAIMGTVLKEELDRLIKMEQAYTVKINSLPKGSIRIKTISGKKYTYLMYRDGNSIKTKYIGLNVDLTDLSTKIEQRKKLKKELCEIKKDIKFIRKVVKN